MERLNVSSYTRNYRQLNVAITILFPCLDAFVFVFNVKWKVLHFKSLEVLSGGGGGTTANKIVNRGICLTGPVPYIHLLRSRCSVEDKGLLRP
jgi:hypothetical protein